MIKRRFYRLEHGDKDAASESSSSDSDEDPQQTDETELEEESEEDDDETDEEIADARKKEKASLSSGYESENSSANEVNLDSSGLPTSDDEVATRNGKQNIVESSSGGNIEQDNASIDEKDCVVKCKSVFKCRLCPRIVCLSEDTLKAHLNSKRHARSVKLLKEGRLKVFLNSDGKLNCEDDPENQASDEEPSMPKKKGKGNRRQRKRQRMDAKPGKAKRSQENRAARRKRIR